MFDLPALEPIFLCQFMFVWVLAVCLYAEFHKVPSVHRLAHIVCFVSRIFWHVALFVGFTFFQDLMKNNFDFSHLVQGVVQIGSMYGLYRIWKDTRFFDCSFLNKKL